MLSCTLHLKPLFVYAYATYVVLQNLTCSYYTLRHLQCIIIIVKYKNLIIMQFNKIA